MATIVAERGQVTLPKALRDKLRIGPGTVLEFSAEEGRLVATKVITDHPAQHLMGRHSKGVLPCLRRYALAHCCRLSNWRTYRMTQAPVVGVRFAHPNLPVHQR